MQNQRLGGCVVALQHTGGAGRGRLDIATLAGLHHLADFAELLAGHRALAQHAHGGGTLLIEAGLQNRALQSFRTGTGIQHQRNGAAQLLHHRRGARGRNVTEAVGARRGNRVPQRTGNRAHHLVARHAAGHRGQPARHDIRHAFLARQHQRHRPRPEFLHQLIHQRLQLCRHLGNLLQRLTIRQVADERVKARPPLHLKNLGHGIRVERIRPQAVYRLRRDSHQPALCQHSSGFLINAAAILQRIHLNHSGLHAPILDHTPPKVNNKKGQSAKWESFAANKLSRPG